MTQNHSLALRPISRSDLPLLEAWHNDSQIKGEFNSFGFSGTHSIDSDYEKSGFLDDRQGMLMIVSPEGEPIGGVSYRSVIYGPNDASRAFSIGIHLVPEQRGRGLGAQAQALLADYLFDTYAVQRIEAETDVENIAERKSLEKAGFTREGILRQAQWRAGAWHDLVKYSKLRGE
ncbi:MAG: GNAT family protein [Anaerolineales bacterium]|jgi:aminoglycoside 6'-N-acetyltransferase